MNDYWIKYTDGVPEKFGGLASGPLIRIRPKYENDVGLFEHEKNHVRQWYAVLALGLLPRTLLALLGSPALLPVCGLTPFLHQLFYRFTRPYRRWCEVQAYRR